MNTDLITVVRQIIAKEGDAILSDSKRVSAYFADMAQNVSKSRKNAFIKCLSLGNVQILQKADKSERANCKQRLAQKLHEEEGLDLGLCNETVELLATVLFNSKPKTKNTKNTKSNSNDKTQCSKCNFSIDSNAKFCSQCGSAAVITTTEIKCTKCHIANAVNSHFCKECGNNLATAKDENNTGNESGSAEMYKIGLNYFNGKNGVEQNHVKAVEWFRKAADMGHVNAQHALAYCYDNGWGVNKDKVKAVKWYKKAAEQGHDVAQNNLGMRYYEGEGIAENCNMAVKWWQAAAEQGNIDAQCNLGHAYENGYGVPRDYDRATEWYQKAANQGHNGAKEQLEYLKNISGVCESFDEDEDDGEAEDRYSVFTDRRLANWRAMLSGKRGYDPRDM